MTPDRPPVRLIAIAVALISVLVLVLINARAPVGDGEHVYTMASAATGGTLCVEDEATREKIRVVMFTALDEALQQHIVQVFGVWMKDDRDQPARASLGVRGALAAYMHARRGVSLWAPTLCPPPP